MGRGFWGLWGRGLGVGPVIGGSSALGCLVRCAWGAERLRGSGDKYFNRYLPREKVYGVGDVGICKRLILG